MIFSHTCFGDTFDCVAVLLTYENGYTALLIVDAEDGSPVATASVNLGPQVSTPDNHIWLKVWSENAGLEDSLAKASIVSLTERRHLVNNHGDSAVLAKLSDELLNARAKSPRT